MRKMIGLFVVLAFCLASVSAQQTKPTSVDRWDAFAGYSLSRIYVANEAPFPMNLNGGQGAITYNFTRHLGATAEVAGYTNDTEDVTFSTQAFLFGPTARFGFAHGKNPRVSFFAHQLFGVTRMTITSDEGETCGTGTSPTCTTHPFTMASGGGVDVKVSKHIWVRPLQLEYFNEQISLDSLVGVANVGVVPSPRSAATPYASAFSGIHITGQGLRYSAGAVYRF